MTKEFQRESAEREPGARAGQPPPALTALLRRIEEITEEIPRSLDADRADYAGVSSLLRPVVILRGLCTRAILRNQRARCRRELSAYYEATAGKPPAEERASPGTKAAPTEPVISTTRLAAEGALLGKALKEQVRDRLFPRLPALVGLIAGWWVANTYTDSHWKSALRSVGIGDGGTHVVSGNAYRLMMIGAPILSAAICAYLSNRLAQFIRKRYAPVDQPPNPGNFRAE